MTVEEKAYVEGFRKAAEAYGVDPDALVKEAQAAAAVKAVTKPGLLKRYWQLMTGNTEALKKVKSIVKEMKADELSDAMYNELVGKGMSPMRAKMQQHINALIAPFSKYQMLGRNGGNDILDAAKSVRKARTAGEISFEQAKSYMNDARMARAMRKDLIGQLAARGGTAAGVGGLGYGTYALLKNKKEEQPKSWWDQVRQQRWY